MLYYRAVIESLENESISDMPVGYFFPFHTFHTSQIFKIQISIVIFGIYTNYENKISTKTPV